MSDLSKLTTEASNPSSVNLDKMTSLELVRVMNAEDARVAAAVASEAEVIARSIDAIADRMQSGGRLIYVGAGTSGRLGVLDATECPPTFNTQPHQVVGVIAGGLTALTRAVEGAEDRPDLAVQDLDALQLAAADVVVGIATSGRTPYVISALQHARSRGCLTIALSCNADSELSRAADCAITPIVGPEILSGSTRLKAGTATKMVLNMLSTGAMVRLGKTFGNLMVDLRATNTKLRDRTRRILQALVDVDSDQAAALVAACGGELKLAIVVGRTGCTTEQARELLEQHGGRVQAAIAGNAGPAHEA